MALQLEEALQTIKVQKDRMEIELNFAREIQMSMLPLIFPALPTRSELSVYATLHSALSLLWLESLPPSAFGKS